MFEVRITKAAERDIQSSYDWWKLNRSAEQAERWIDAIYPAIATLQEMPQRCFLATENEFYSGELKQLLFGVGRRATHRILFAIEEDQVIIFRVRHVSQQDLSPDDLG